MYSANMGLLREYLKEAIGAADPWASGKDAGNNLYMTGPYEQPAGIRRRGGNVLDDEEREEQEDMQGTRQAACCLVLADDGTVLAVSRKDDPMAFGLPGGKVDPGETPEQAAARELHEETGLQATSLRQVFVRKEDDGFTTTTFVCKVSGQIDTPESGVVRWVTPQTLFDGPFGGYNRALWDRLGLPA